MAIEMYAQSAVMAGMAIAGESGTGKSTLFRLAREIDRPPARRMTMDVIRDTSAKNARSAKTRENGEGFNEETL